MCDFSLQSTQLRPQRSATSLRPTISGPVHAGSPRPKISKLQSAFFLEQSLPSLRR
jgi:hypothetical protein